MGLRANAAGEAAKTLAEPANPLTIGGWAKRSAAKGTYACLWSWESGDPGSSTSAQLLLTTDSGETTLDIYDGAMATTLLATLPAIGTWFPWAITINSAPNTMIGYAKASATAATSSQNVGTISTTGLDRFLLMSNSYSAEFWDGVVDNVWVDNSVLTQTEIENRWFVRRPVGATHYIWSPMIDSTVADALKDYSGNGRDWTQLGTLAVEDGAPVAWGGSIYTVNGVAAGGGTQNLDPDSITSLEAFGTPVLTVGAVTVSPSSIDSAEAFGSPALTLYLLPSSVTSEEAFGTPILTAGAVDIAPSSIASAEAFGEPAVGQAIAPSSIDSAESFGTPQLNLSIAPSSIASAESVSTDADVDFTPQTVSPDSVTSAEAFGSPQLNLIIYPDAIASAENVPAPLVDDGTGGATPTLYQRRKSRFLRRSQVP